MKEGTPKQSWQNEFFVAKDGIRIRYSRFNSKLQPTRILLFVNGRNEFIEKYHHIRNDLILGDSCTLVTWDHRGQGESDGVRSHCISYDQYVDDMLSLMEEVNSKKLPYSIVGHSMGALICIYGMCKKRIDPETVVLTAPFFGLPHPKSTQFFLKIFSTAMTTIGLGQWHLSYRGEQTPEIFKTNLRTTCEKQFERLLGFRFIGKSATFAWLRASFEAINTVFNRERIAELRVPIHVISPSLEAIVSRQDIKKWFEIHSGYFPQSGQFHEIPAARHELFIESPEPYQKALDIINAALSK